MAIKNVQITVSEQHFDTLDQVVQKAESVGFKLDRVLGVLGIIDGAIEEADIIQLENLDEVDAVEMEQKRQTID